MENEKFEVTKDKGEFTIGQVYETEMAQAIRCRTCGGDQFVVGVASYFTAIKCRACRWELCIHDG